MARLRIAVLISGRGSNLQALIEACRDPGMPAEIVLVVSNRPGAAGLGGAANRSQHTPGLHPGTVLFAGGSRILSAP